MEKKALTVEILGTTLTLRSEEGVKHLEEVVSRYKLQVEQIQTELSISEPLKIALLSGFNLVSDFIKHQKEFEDTSKLSATESARIGTIADNLIQRIDNCLIEG